MPIEFRCTKCGKLLRTPDDTAGKQARCPECGTILPIPAAAQPNAPLAAPQPAAGALPAGASPGAAAEMLARSFAPAAGAAGANPYQSPTSGSRLTTAKDTGYGKLEFGNAHRRTWKIFTTNLGSCIAVVVLYWVLLTALMFAAGMCMFAIVMAFSAAGGGPAAPAGMVVGIVITYVSVLLVLLYFNVGQMNFFLKVSRGDFDADISKLFTGGRWVLPTLGAGILFAVCVLAASLLLIVPGIIVMLMLSQCFFLIIDRDLGVIEAFGESRRITSGNKGMLLVTVLLPAFVIWLALAAPGVVLQSQMIDHPFLVIGLQFMIQLVFALLVTPWFSVLWAVCYLIMSGQTTADRAAPGNMAARGPESERAV